MQRLAVGIVSKTFFYVPYWAALARGTFEQAGLAVETTVMGNASQIEPLTRGELDVVIGTPEGVVQNAATGGALRVVAGQTGALSHFVIAQPRFKRIQDLRGATLGILSRTEGTFFHVQTVMAAHGLRYPGDYEVRETGGAPARHQALLDGTIDMGLQSIPLVYVEEEQGFSNLGDVSTYVPDWQFNSINVDATHAQQRGEVIVRFLRAMLVATEWVHGHRDEAAGIAEREMNIAREHALRGWDYYIGKNVLTRDLSINEKGMAKVIELQRSAGLIASDAPVELAHYVEPRYLNEARGQQ